MNLINTLRMYAEDAFSVRGANTYSTTLSLAADLLEEQKGTIAKVKGGRDE